MWTKSGVTIHLRPDLTSYFISAYIITVTVAATARTLDPICHYGTRSCTLVEIFFYPLAASVGGVVLSCIALRRQVLILDADGIRRRIGHRERLIRWADMSLIAEVPGAGRRYRPAIVIEHGIGRLFYIYDSTRISGRDLFLTIDHYVTTHSIKVATRAV